MNVILIKRFRIIFLAVLMLFVGCNKKEEINTSSNNIPLPITEYKDTSKANDFKIENKQVSFEEFVKEFTIESQKSKEYFINNSASAITAEYYMPNATGKRNIIRKGTLSNSKYYGYFKWHFNVYSGKKKIEKIGDGKISYKFSDIEIMYFLFKKDDEGNWKFYKVISPAGEVEPTVL